jgi:uncharacterized integral membrane protein
MTESGGLSKGQVKLILAIVMITLIVIIAMQNWEEVGITLLFAELTMSKFLLILSAFGAGVLFGWLMRKRR